MLRLRRPLFSARHPSAPGEPAPGATQFERQARLTEAFLLLFVLAVLFSGAFLVATAKSAAVSQNAPSVVNINVANAEKLAQALHVSPVVSKRLLLDRTGRGGGQWDDVDAIGRVPLVPKTARAAALVKLAGLRSPQSATRLQLQTALPGWDAGERTRLLEVRDALGDKATWEKLFGTPLVSPLLLADAAPRLVVRNWAEAARVFWQCVLALAAFFVVTHFVLRRFRPRADPFLFPIAALLATCGFLLLFALKDPVRDRFSFAAQTQGIVMGGGLALLFTLSGWWNKLPLHRYGYGYALLAVAGTLVLGVAGSGPGGVRLAVAGAQPVEAIKILLVFFLAAYLADRGNLLNDPLRKWGPFPLPPKRDLLPLVILYALPLALFALVKDLGPVLLLFGTFLLLLSLATGRGVYVALGVVALLFGGWVGYKLHFGVFETRVDMWLSPWANGRKSGDHLVLGLWGLASGGTWGSGLGLGGTRFIPRGGSDLVFAAWGEETGLPGTLVLVACFLALMGRGLRIARLAATDFDRYLAAGLSGLLALQALVIMAGNLGLFPLTGITLPLVAYGKSSLVASFFAVGVLLAISARSPEVATAAFAPSAAYLIAARNVALFFGATLGVVVPLRLLWVQEIVSARLAAQTVRVPDADNVVRPHRNPRLLFLSNQIGRGKLLDRTGRIVAETKNNKRVYPYGAALGHVIGYADPAVGGPTGLEKQFAPQLRGFDQWEDLVGVWRRKDLPSFHLPQGQNVTLTLDAELQKAALRALTSGAASIRDRRTGRPKNRGAVVVLDVETGGVLAAVTLPTFDPNALTPAVMQSLSTDVNGTSTLLNRATQGFYPPGSTFKIVSASSLLLHQKSDFTYFCNHHDANVYWKIGNVRYARKRIVDDETDRPHGTTDLTEAVAQSCNIYFAHAGLTLGPDALRQTAQVFGFSHLPAQKAFDAELPDIAYGQGPMLASPLEMASVAQTIANNGKKIVPNFVANTASAPQTLLSPEQANALTSMMERVTTSGTAGGRFSGLPYTVAGKTGTAQNNTGDKNAHSWFIGFAPANHPKVAFAVIVENGGYGASVAAPIARKVLEAALP